MASTYLIFVPELVERILVYVRMALGVNAILKLERIDVVDLLELFSDLCRHALLLLVDVEHVLLGHLLMLENRLQPLVVVDFLLRNVLVTLRLLLLVVMGDFRERLLELPVEEFLFVDKLGADGCGEASRVVCIASMLVVLCLVLLHHVHDMLV